MREWSDYSGRFRVEAELITADKNLVVLERKDGDLLTVKRNQLSDADQQFVEKHLADKQSSPELVVDSRWKLRDGDVIVGRLIGFGRQELNVRRERGDLWINDHRLEKFPTAYRKLLPNIVSAIDGKSLRTLEELEDHLAELGGGPFQYTVEGIQLDLKDWGAVTIPIALLTTEEAMEIAPALNRWRASQEDDVSEADRRETESRERLALESRDRLRRRPQPTGLRQMQMLELSLLAADAGVTDIWEVAVYPPNRYGYGRTVFVSARNSLLARQRVAQIFPQWRIGAIAKRSN